MAKLMADAHNLTTNLTAWEVLNLWMSHPRQISAANCFLTSVEEEAIVALVKLFMSLPEIHNLVTNLRQVKVSLLKRCI
jgi:hypothetical protein